MGAEIGSMLNLPPAAVDAMMHGRLITISVLTLLICAICHCCKRRRRGIRTTALPTPGVAAGLQAAKTSPGQREARKGDSKNKKQLVPGSDSSDEGGSTDELEDLEERSEERRRRNELRVKPKSGKRSLPPLEF